MALTPAPVKPDCFTSNGEILTDISWKASREIGLPPPGNKSLVKPKLLLRLAPSTVTLFNLLSLPAKLVPLACGVIRVKSVMLLVMVGMVASNLGPILVVAPFLSAEERLLVPVMVTAVRSVILVLISALILYS